MKPLLIKIISMVGFSLFLCVSISAQDTLQKGIELYKTGKFNQAIKVLKKVKKNEKDSYLGFHHLGLAFEKLGKSKKAINAFKTSTKLNSEYSKSKTALAYLYLKALKYKYAIKLAEKAILIDPKDYRNYYIVGFASHRIGRDTEAVQYVDKSIEINPDYAEAYYLKYKALKIPKGIDTESKAATQFYKERRQYLAKFMMMIADSPNSTYWKNNLESVKAFANYYEKRKALGEEDEDEENKTNLKVLTKPKPGYTNAARRAGIGGIVRILTAFKSDGQIGATLVLEGIGYGLDEQARRAVRKIAFEPAMKDGKPITVVRIVQYSFQIG